MARSRRASSVGVRVAVTSAIITVHTLKDWPTSLTISHVSGGCTSVTIIPRKSVGVAGSHVKSVQSPGAPPTVISGTEIASRFWQPGSGALILTPVAWADPADKPTKITSNAANTALFSFI